MFLKWFLLSLVSFSIQGNELSILNKIGNKYKKEKTFEASFVKTQTNYFKRSKRERKSFGYITLKFPDKMRWEVKKPDPNVFTTNGKTFMYYTPPFDKEDRGQLIISKKVNPNSRLLIDILYGKFNKNNKYLININSQDKDNYVVSMKPKVKLFDLKNIDITISKKDLLIKRVSLFYKEGSNSVIDFSKIKIGRNIKDNNFIFHPSRGTEVIYE